VTYFWLRLAAAVGTSIDAPVDGISSPIPFLLNFLSREKAEIVPKTADKTAISSRRCCDLIL